MQLRRPPWDPRVAPHTSPSTGTSPPPLRSLRWRWAGRVCETRVGRRQGTDETSPGSSGWRCDLHLYTLPGGVLDVGNKTSRVEPSFPEQYQNFTTQVQDQDNELVTIFDGDIKGVDILP